MKSKEEVLEQYIEEEGVTGAEYEIYTDDEADEKAKELILDLAWAFDRTFLSFHCGNIDPKVLGKLDSLGEDANEVILRLIYDKDYFVRDAIASDGRGHFMSFYDGEEVEFKGYFIYRVD